jgi:hypothetical protein
VLARLAGPALIVGSGLFVMRDFAFRGLLTSGDVVRYWLPMHCFMGRTLTAGHIASWNPFALSGMPFAADPQSGWLGLLPMGLFTTLGCGTAIRWEVILPPLLAGLGLYWFLRSEDVSRPAASMGGLALVLAIAGTRLPSSIRFPEALAWTTLLLAATSRYLRAPSWPRRLLWCVAVAVAWGQVAASHITVGLLIGSLALASFLAAKLIPALRMRRSEAAGMDETTAVATGRGGGRREALLLLVILAAALPAVNLAYFLPRLALAPHTSLGLGYGQLNRLSSQLTGAASPEFPGFGAGPAWPLNFATFPGLHLGAAVLGLSLAGWWSRRRRALVAAFSAFGLLCYLLGLRVVSHNLPARIRSVAFVDQYLHEPYWLSFGVLLSVAALAALGLEAWMERRSFRSRAWMLVPPLLVWMVLPLIVGSPVRDLVLTLIVGIPAGAALALVARRPRWSIAIPVLVLAEMLGAIVQGRPALPFADAPRLLPLRIPGTTSPAAYLRPTKISEALRKEPSGRYLTFGAKSGNRWSDRRALQNNESILLELDNVGGYQAVQLLRYWLFVRTVQRAPMKYNYAIFSQPRAVALDLLDVRWLVGATGQAVARDGPWVLARSPSSPSRASVVDAWTVAPTADAALRLVASPGFDASKRVILERDPGLPADIGQGPPASIPGGTAMYRSTGLQSARVDVDAFGPSIVLIRNPWDRDWHATLDGREVPVLAADYVDQGVAVTAGHHVIELIYDDPTIGLGLAGSALAIGILLGLALAVRARSARRGPGGAAPVDGSL